MASFCIISAEAGDKISTQTAELLEQIRHTPQSHMTTGARRAMHIVGAPQDERLDCIIQLSDDDCCERLHQMGVQTGRPSGHVVTARIPLNMIDSVLQLDCVELLEPAEDVEPANDEARKRSHVEAVWNGSTQEGIDAYTGKGVIVGIVDEGFDLSHPAFMKPNRISSRIRSFWNQRGDTLNPPQGFDYGTVYTNQLSYLLIGTEYNSGSHGTHVAGIASGSDTVRFGRWRGMAPEADIVLVGTNMTNTGIMDGIQYVCDVADRLDMPCVINLSISSYSGERDGTKLFDRFVNGLCRPGRLIVGAAGNTAAYEHQASKRYGHLEAAGSAAGDAYAQTRYYYTGSAGTQHGMIAWGRDAGKPIRSEILLYDTKKDTLIARYDAHIDHGTRTQTYKVNYPADSSYYYGTVTTRIQQSTLNDKYYTQIFWTLNRYQNTAIYLRLYPDENSKADAWPTKYSAYFLSGDNNSTVTNTGGIGDSIITVGAYFSRISSTSSVLDSICNFSSHGPTIDGRLKPEITAPGGVIVSAYSRFYSAGRTSWVDSTSYLLSVYPYGTMQGTSMSTPHVTGILATWLQAFPTMSRSDVMEIFKHTAIQDRQTGTTPNNTWGYGKIDAWAGLKAAIRLAAGKPITSGLHTAVPDRPFMMRQTADAIEVVYTCATQASLQLYAADGRLVASVPMQTVGQGDEQQIRLTGMPHGMYVFRVQTSLLSESVRIIL